RVPYSIVRHRHRHDLWTVQFLTRNCLLSSSRLVPNLQLFLAHRNRATEKELSSQLRAGKRHQISLCTGTPFPWTRRLTAYARTARTESGQRNEALPQPTPQLLLSGA